MLQPKKNARHNERVIFSERELENPKGLANFCTEKVGPGVGKGGAEIWLPHSQ